MVDVDFSRLLAAEREADKKIEETHKKAQELISQAKLEAQKIFEEKSKIDEKEITERVRKEVLVEFEEYNRYLTEELRKFKENIETKKENIINGLLNKIFGVEK